MAEQALQANRGLAETGHFLRQRVSGVFAKSYALPLILSSVPLIIILLLSLLIFYTTFSPRLPTTLEWTLQHWANLFDPRLWTDVIPNTLIVGLGAVAVALFFAGPMAWLIVRTTIPLKKTLLTCVALVMVLPPFVKSMGWVLLLNERVGIVNRILVGILPIESLSLSVNNVWGIAWVMGLTLMPTTFFLIAGPMRQMDPAMEEAASICGVSRFKTFFYVTMPLVWPAALAAGIFTFMTAISLFEVPAIIVGLGGGTPVLATEMFFAVYREDGTTIRYGAAGVYAVLMMIPSLVGLYFYFKVINKAHRFSVVTGKGYRPHDVDIGRWKWPALAFIGLFLLCAAVLPLLWLIWISLASFRLPSLEAMAHLNFQYYDLGYIVSSFGGWEVILNTLLLIFWVCVGVIFFSIMISWVVVRTELKIRRLVDGAAILPHAIPGLAFAFAIFIAVLILQIKTGWIALVGTLSLLVTANVLNHLSYTTRVTNAALIQVHNELEEAARVCGLSPMKTIFFIVIPLIRPALVFATVWVALRTFRELTMALFLTGTDNKVMAVQVWLLWNEGGLAQAAAGAVVMTIGCGILLLIGFILAKESILNRAVA